MSNAMDDEIKRWTAKRMSALVLDIIQGKTTVAVATCAAYSASKSCTHRPDADSRAAQARGTA
jgi:H+/gluconate symporter-like permease